MIRLAVGVVTIVLTLILLALCDCEALPACRFDRFDPTQRERVREISLQAIDKGLEQAVSHLYSIWQKDPESDQPKRAQVGITNALDADARARKFALGVEPTALLARRVIQGSRLFLPCSFAVAHRQFSGEYGPSLSMRSANGPAVAATYQHRSFRISASARRP